MRSILIIAIVSTSLTMAISQDVPPNKSYQKHGVVWSGGLFKSWLKDYYVDFNDIGGEVTPVFSSQKKLGLAFNSHYMWKPTRMFGVGVHLGLGLDTYSYVESPVLLFGLSLSYGADHEFIVNVGWADSKRRYVPSGLRTLLEEGEYNEIPTLHEYTQFNTAYYLGISYRIF